MKERIVINQDWLVKDMKAGVVENDKLFICQKVEQIPETFEELKGLCENIKCCYVGENYISISERNISFLNDGQIRCNYYNITNKATPQQMWQIIKSLIGEE